MKNTQNIEENDSLTWMKMIRLSAKASIKRIKYFLEVQR